MCTCLKKLVWTARDARSKIHWQQYRSFFSIAILKYFVVWFAIVPVFAFIFSDLPNQLQLSGVNPTVGIRVGLPFNWAVLWIASLAYTTALIIYGLVCPDFITKYHNYKEYQDEQHSPRWIPWITSHAIGPSADRGAEKLVRRLITKGYLVEDPQASIRDLKCEVYVEHSHTRMVLSYQEKMYSLAMPIRDAAGHEDSKRTAEVEKDTFWEVFGHYARSRLWARVIILMLLTPALLLFLWVLGEHIMSGLPYVVRTLSGA